MSFDPEYAVVIVRYDPRWPSLFEVERTRILAVIGVPEVVVEHVGSTAVEGLAAKPIIDLLIGLPNFEDAGEAVPPLEGLGYEYLPEKEVELPERKFLARPVTKPRTHHIHMVEIGSDFWERHLLFRDYLRSHASTAGEYETLKRELAVRYRLDREAYTEGKTEFVRRVEEEARSARGHSVSPGLRADSMEPQSFHESD